MEMQIVLDIARGKVRKLIKNKRGATVVEYGLLLVAVLLLVAAVFKALGAKVGTTATRAAGVL